MGLRCTVSSFWPQRQLIRLLCCVTLGIVFLTFNSILMSDVGFERTVIIDKLANSNIVHHIAFVKTHKAASSTVFNILYRFALRRDLVVLMPKKGNYLYGRYLNKTNLLPPPKGRIYDILCNHAIFNHTSFSQFLPPDTVYIGIVREPFDRFLSAFYYYRYEQYSGYLRRIPGKYNTILRTYFKKPLHWEPKNPMASMTNNRMAIDFGFPPEHFNNSQLFDGYLMKLNTTFRIVLVSELFDESIILMKRAFNWTIKDILYTIKNKARRKPQRPLISEEMKRIYQNLSSLDYRLYTFFLTRLYRQIEQEGELFQAEVEYFRTVRNKVARFCDSEIRTPMQIGSSNWTAGFNVTRVDCSLLTVEEQDFVTLMRRRLKKRITRDNANKHFFNKLPD